MSTWKNTTVTLQKRPVGGVEPTHFAFTNTSPVELDDGQVLVRTLYLSVDPYMRGRMNAAKSYIPPFELGQPIVSGGIGQIVETAHLSFRKGDIVVGMLPWQEISAVSADGLRRAIANAPLPVQLGMLGMPGLTAYVGLLDIGQPKPGETVFVSGAAGAVGSVVGQLAKIQGCHVVGSAGSEDKAQFLKRELGFDAAFNYKATDDLPRKLAELCPNGIDVYFDNVGGSTLDAALVNINQGARLPLCGMIAQYNDVELPPGPRHLMELVRKRARMQGFIVSDHSDRMKDFVPDMLRWMNEGRLQHHETIIDGIEQAPNAFIGMLKGDNLGKMLVRVGAPKD